MLYNIILSAQETGGFVNEYLELIISILTIIGMVLSVFFALKAPIRKLETQMATKVDEKTYLSDKEVHEKIHELERKSWDETNKMVKEIHSYLLNKG